MDIVELLRKMIEEERSIQAQGMVDSIGYVYRDDLEGVDPRSQMPRVRPLEAAEAEFRQRSLQESLRKHLENRSVDALIKPLLGIPGIRIEKVRD